MSIKNVSGLALAFVAGLLYSRPAAAQNQLRFEAEDVSEPASAWLTNKSSQTHWNLWSQDKDAKEKWSGGVVLHSPPVLEDRKSPEDGAPVLHTRIAGLTNGIYDIGIQGGRTLGISMDGRAWRPFNGGLIATEFAVTNGVVEFWVDDRYAYTKNPGSAYYDYITLTPVPVPVQKPKIEGHATKRVEEKLDRGLVAMPVKGGVYLGWRLLKSDPPDAAFHVYRGANGGAPERISKNPISQTTDFTDAAAPARADLKYSVRLVANGSESPSDSEAAIRLNPDAEMPACISLKLEEGETFQKCAVADLDGDGRYDFILKTPNASIDPAGVYWKRSPDTYKLDARRSDGTRMWTYDLGWSIEQGIWYSPMIAYDFDGDGKAEVAVKIGEGDPRDADGRVKSGPEWVAILDGATGRELARAPWPDRSGFGDGERSYNLASRNQLAVAYLDGRTPCLIVLRGTYNLMKADAYDFDGKNLRQLWTYRSTEAGRRFSGQGGHFTHCADIDGDGRDELLLGSAVIDDNGSPLWSTGLGHPDNFFVGDLMPQRPGMEIFYGIEPALRSNGMCMADAATGKILWGWNGPTKHIHSIGLCSDIDPCHPGVECYGADCINHIPTGDRWLFSSSGEVLSRTFDLKFGRPCVYWDADLQREIVAGDRVRKYEGGAFDPRIEGKGTILTADILGDWREEILVTQPGELRIYTTTIPAMDRRVTFMQDPIYRLDVAMGAMGYTLNPTVSYDLESRAPNLNLTALEKSPGNFRVVVSAPRDAALEGKLSLACETATLSPDSLDIKLKPGERRIEEIALKRTDPKKPATVRAELKHAGGILRGMVIAP